MAMIRCKECKKKISSKAQSCPNCGAPVEISEKENNKPKRKGRGCLLAFLILILVGIFILIGVTNTMDTSSPPKQPNKSSQEKIHASGTRYKKKPPDVLPAAFSALQYEIVDKDIYDTPIKTQVQLHAVVSGTITKAGLENLLQKLYAEAQATRGFKHHGGKPTHIFISRETSR